MMIEQALYTNNLEISRLDVLRRRINDENYLHAAIQRLALVMSNELMGIPVEGGRNERQRKRQK